MTKEQKFFEAVKDVFVGAKVEGESGYINLMRIKSRYYERGVFPKLQKDIDDALKAFPAFRDGRSRLSAVPTAAATATFSAWRRIP